MIAPTFVIFGFALQVLVAAWALVVPDRTRPDLLFAVTVDPALRRRPDGRAIVARYRWEAAVVTAVSIGLFAAAIAARLQAGFLAAILLQAAGLLLAYFRARARTLPFAVTPTTVRETVLDPRPAVLPAAWVQAGPFAILAGAAWYLHAHWSSIPLRMPVHWGFDGRPDRWAARTIAGVYSGPVTAAVICAALFALAWATAHHSRQIRASGPAGDAEHRFRRMMLWLMLGCEYFMAVIFTLTAWQQVHPASAGTVLAVVPLGTLVFAAAFGFLLLKAGQGGTHLPGAAAAAEGTAVVGDRTDDRYWKAGIIYANPTDPALFVEKRFGGGYTMNMSHPAAWLLLAGLILLILVLLLVPWLTHH